MARRRIVANITLTLDGRITGPGGNDDMGWVLPHAFSDVVRDHLDSAVGRASTALLGSVNSEGYAAVWPPVADDPEADRRDRAFARWLVDVDKVVLSSTGRSTWPDARVRSGDTAALVRELREEPGGDVLVLSSVSIIMELLRADLVDVLSLVLVPEILGGGRSLFEDGLPASGWTLTGSTVADSGALALTYERASV